MKLSKRSKDFLKNWQTQDEINENLREALATIIDKPNSPLEVSAVVSEGTLNVRFAWVAHPKEPTWKESK